MTHHGRGLFLSWWGWLIIVGVAAAVVLIGVLAYFRDRQSDGLSRVERRELDALTAEILTMLRQTGRPVAQPEIGETVPMDPDDIAQAVQDLEARGLVRREWSSERQAYMVTPT